MEAIFFLLIGAALFSQSWYVLGLYSEGRTVGLIVGGLGLLTLGTIMFGTSLTPNIITGDGTAELTAAITGLIVLWSVYCIAVAGHGLWDFEDRAIGFYSAFLAVASLVIFIYITIAMGPGGAYGKLYSTGVWLAMSAVPLVLTIIASITFFYLAFQFQLLRLVTGWFLLLGSAVITAVGLGIVATAIM